MSEEARASLRAGLAAGTPFAVAAALVAISFGVPAAPVLGVWPAIAMSAIVFAGSAQFAALAVLAAGGDPAAAVIAGILLNARYIPMGIALAPSLRGGALRRGLVGQGMVDASWALAMRGSGRFDPAFMVGATLTTYPRWVGGTAIGVLLGDSIGDPAALGLDALFPAFFLGLLIGGEAATSRRALAAALLGAAIAAVLLPFAPPGVPIIAASAAALIGLAPQRGDGTPARKPHQEVTL